VFLSSFGTDIGKHAIVASGSLLPKKKRSTTTQHPLMSHTSRYVSMAYPSYTMFHHAMLLLPISTRSVIVKCCQAQKLPKEDTVLHNLLLQEPPVSVSENNRIPSGTFEVIDLLQLIDFDPSDPLESAIYLDIIRFAAVDPFDVMVTKEKGWWKEINLAMGVFRDLPVDWSVIFSPHRFWASHNQLHPDLPPNPNMANDIYNSLVRFRHRMEGAVLYSRASHKNMSWETRREFEESANQSLDNEAIFGQDDYLRYYHETGILLGGATEMRQKWYHSGVKPRTYFAMGGHAYSHSRFLQDVFSRLVDSFPSFNHKTRLRPGRLSVPSELDGEDIHWRIYDLSSFTSNCCIQRSFVEALAEFCQGVDVTIVDERVGPICKDLGDMLLEYLAFCVIEPPLTLERFDSSLVDVTFFHQVASMLGIFGNLMTCTFAHGVVVGMSSPDVDSNEMYNCAGDDGLIPERLSTGFHIDAAIRIVGSYEPTKSFRGDDEAAVCLKRPFEETFPQPGLTLNIVPPTLATVVTLLDSSYSDPRYDIYPMEGSWIDRVNIVARDLFRFLRSAYMKGYQDNGRLGGIVLGFEKVVQRLTGWRPSPGISIPGVRPFWPINPGYYEFNDISPYHCVLLYTAPPLITIPKWEKVADISIQYEEAGEEFEGNSTKRLKMLEMLGYVTKEQVWVATSDIHQVLLLESLLFDDNLADHDPVVYKYTVLKTIPFFFMYSD
jgi:hypothetical protein